jgi:hypothetical protein
MNGSEAEDSGWQEKDNSPFFTLGF